MRAPALIAWGTLCLVACASVALVACAGPQFGVRNDNTVAATSATTPSTAAPTTSGSSTSAPSASATTTTPATSASDNPAPSSSAAAKAPARKTIIARHILIQWMGCRSADANIVRTKEQARTVALDVLRRLKAGEEFTRLVLDYSDEPNAGRRGGSLPPFGHGTMDKAFEAAAFALAPGELSGVVETQFGFHVIQRLE